MKKKTLIVPVVAAMLAVSCGNNPTPVKDWSQEKKDFMTAELGEVLPYFDFDAASLYWETDHDEFGGYVFAFDDNQTNLVESYGEKLLAAEFQYDAQSEAYYKRTDKSTIKFGMYYYTPSESSQELPGNVINIEYMYNEEPSIGAWSEDVQAAMTNMFGYVFPYASIDKGEIFRTGKTTDMGFYMYGTVESNKLVTYFTRLEREGFEVYQDLDGSVYALKVIGDNEVRVDAIYLDAEEAAKYGYDSGVNELDFTITSAKLNHFPDGEIAKAIEYFAEETISVPDLETAGEGVYYIYEEEAYNGGVFFAAAYGYGVTSIEIQRFILSLIGNGWLVSGAGDGDYILYLPESKVSVNVSDYSSSPDEEDPYTVSVLFYSYGDDNGPIDNGAVAKSLVFLLGLSDEDIVAPTEEGDTTYTIQHSFNEAPLDVINQGIGAAVSYSGYYFFNEDLSSVEYEDPEAEEKVVKAYKYYFLSDGWTEDNNGQQVYTEVSKDPEVAGQVNVKIVISGVPAEKIWTMQSVFEALLANEDSKNWIAYGPFDNTTYILGVGLFVPQYKETVQKFVLEDFTKVLKGFVTEQTEWLKGQYEDGTEYEYYRFEWTSKDGTKKVVFEIDVYYDEEYEATRFDYIAIDVVPNPETPETPEAGE